MKVVAEGRLDHLSNVTDRGFLVGDDIADLDNHRSILGKEGRNDEVVLEWDSQILVAQSEGITTTGMAYDLPCGRLQAVLARRIALPVLAAVSF